MEYLPNYNSTVEDITFESFLEKDVIRKIPLLDLSVILDNLVSNSVKANATKIHIVFKNEKGRLIVDFSDNGVGVDLENTSSNSIFELGITNRRDGSGIGLSTIKDTMRRSLKGDILFVGNSVYFHHGATFRLIF